jgi:carboxymethylenebutenolidase
MDKIEITSSDGFAFGALHAVPAGASRGGVIVVQEIFGLDHNVEVDVARWQAAGFEGLAPSMFDRVAPGFVADHDPAGFAAGIGHMQANGFDNPMLDVTACVDFLAPRGPVFLVGYCYGGLVGWLAAGKLSGLAAVSSYYGQVARFAELTPRCPIECHFGAQDPHIDAAAVATVKAAQPQVPVYVYAGSGHGFNNDHAEPRDPADVELARARTLALFKANGAK